MQDWVDGEQDGFGCRNTQLSEYPTVDFSADEGL